MRRERKRGSEQCRNEKGSRRPAALLRAVFLPFLLFVLVSDAVQLLLTELSQRFSSGGGWAAHFPAEYPGEWQALVLMLAAGAGLGAARLAEELAARRGAGESFLRGFPEVSLRPRSPWRMREKLFSAALCVSLGLALNILLMQSGPVEAGTGKEAEGLVFRTVWPVAFLCYGLVCPLAEELIFRGVVYGRLRRAGGVSAAALVSAALFGVWHGNLRQGLYGFAMGLVLSLLYESSEELRIPVFLHGLTNTVIFTLGGLGVLQSAPEGIAGPGGSAVFLAAAGVSAAFLIREGMRGTGKGMKDRP
ncbi:CPBP family intramembrane glutamic endopeptidase [Lachnoclostridium sp. Marseille-P6806]|uniref:CPBP family intramembrane glutamic endopeptidase n=1 Tax=Lachnoclostridium sp. Marseille-P6806 TaxID=2364793 RepID=UPI001030EC48|nr:CPBP family intramembrane glutamic endopeptidase [Lachnoclostridium sp. Marseille-P6806]